MTELPSIRWVAAYDDISDRWWPTMYQGEAEVGGFTDVYGFPTEAECVTFIMYLPRFVLPVHPEGIANPDAPTDSPVSSAMPADLQRELEGDSET